MEEANLIVWGSLGPDLAMICIYYRGAANLRSDQDLVFSQFPCSFYHCILKLEFSDFIHMSQINSRLIGGVVILVILCIFGGNEGL